MSLNKYKKYKEEARALAHERAHYFANLYGVRFGRIAIRNSRSRWGSCSSRGNLNFNYRIAFLSPELLDYVVIHEVCHLVHFNHSSAFWAEVARTVPEWKALRRQLHAIHL